jgi:hypothetical protein
MNKGRTCKSPRTLVELTRPARSRHRGLVALTVALVAAVMLVALPATAVAMPSTPTRYQESDGRFYYSPAWSTSTYYQYSGGKEKYTSARKGSVVIPFEGSSLDWIAKTGSQMGIALVSVDGGAAVEVDLYSPATYYQKKVYSTGELTFGLHFVKITRSGTKNLNATGTAVTIDAVDVLGTLARPTRYQESERGIKYGGTWNTNLSWRFSGGTMKTCAGPVAILGGGGVNITNVSGDTQVATLDPGGMAMLRFYGVRLNVLATKGRGYGKAWISVDGGPRVLVDLYSYTTKYRQTVFSTGFLPPGTHTVWVGYSGFKNRYSKGYNINLDAFDVIGELGGGPA